MWRWITLDLLASIFSILGKFNYTFTDTNPPPLSSLNHCFFQFVVFPFSVSLSRLLPHELKAAEILDDNKVISTIPYKISFVTLLLCCLSHLQSIVSLRNRTAGRRRRQNARVWQTWQGYFLRVLSYLHLTSMFSGLLQKDLFTGRWILAKSYFKQNYCHAVVEPI